MLETLLALAAQSATLSTSNYSLNWDAPKEVQVAQASRPNPARQNAKLGTASFYYPSSDPLELTASASPQLYPVGTRLRITNLETHLSVDVMVNYSSFNPHTPRTLDISREAAVRVDAVKSGRQNPFPVLIQVLPPQF